MPKAVEGFMSEDDQFFTTEDEARRHELELRIRLRCGPLNVNPERLFPVLEALADLLVEYLDVSSRIPEQIPNPVAGEHSSNDGLTEEPETLQSFETDGYKPMSNMGRRPSAKAIRNQRKGDGT